MQMYRQIRAKAARSSIRIPRVWWWHRGLTTQDAFLASYPRSGSTWLRFILFEILTGGEAGFQKIEQTLPEIGLHRGVPPILSGGGRLIKTHETFRNDYKKAVFLVRDVRDVFLSCYAAAVEVGLASLVSAGDRESFLWSFLKGRALAFGSWQNHVCSWLDSPLARNGHLLVIRYEDLRHNSERVLTQLLAFLGVRAEAGTIRTAIENNSLKQMRAKEDKARRVGERSALLECHKAAQEDGRFVRKGAVGGWRGTLTDTEIKVIQQYAGDALRKTGYDLGVANDVPCSTAISATGI